MADTDITWHGYRVNFAQPGTARADVAEAFEQFAARRGALPPHVLLACHPDRWLEVKAVLQVLRPACLLDPGRLAPGPLTGEVWLAVAGGGEVPA